MEVLKILLLLFF